MTHIAVVQYEIESLSTWQAYEDKILRIVEQAKEKNANLLTMSEYAGLELASWMRTAAIEEFEHIQTLLDQYIKLFSSLANQYQLYIQPGTLPVRANDGFYRNRAYFFSPNGNIAYQDKIFLTPFERSTNIIRSGTELNIFDTEFGKLSIMICYDSEFPALASPLAKAGVKLILVPSCTEKISGLTRVSICSRARAIENQCFVAQSSLVGKASGSDFIDINNGQSGVYSPADISFCEDGLLALAELNMPVMIHTKLDWEKLDYVRRQGEVTNFHDMQLDINPTLNAVKL